MNFETTWRRLLYDFEIGMFIKHPYELDLISKNISAWEKWIMDRIFNNTFKSRSAFYCNVPKQGGLIRPGCHLTIPDNFFYLWLLGQSYDRIFNTLQWSQGKVDIAYELTGKSKEVKWIVNQFSCWENFRELSLKKLDEGFPYVIITDITGYYENIDHQILYSDLLSCEIEEPLVIEIKKAIKRWAIIQGKGIPQGSTASHILAKVYLNSIDIALRDSKIDSLRYVDDIRIFCKSKSQAKKSLERLIELLRYRGLNLQSAKTKILTEKDARISFEGVKVIIEQIIEKINKNEKPIIKSFSISTPSFSDTIETEVIESILAPDSIQVIEETFRANFLESSQDSFDKTLFHFLLNRLAKANSTFAVDFCLSNLEKHPEETEQILKYFRLTYQIETVIEPVVDFIVSDLATYSYQNYQLIKWINENLSKLDDAIVGKIRNFGNSAPKEFYLQTEINRFLGKFGNIADLEKLEANFINCTTDLQKAETIINLQKMEISKRNSFFSKVKDDCDFVNIAIDFVKGKK